MQPRRSTRIRKRDEAIAKFPKTVQPPASSSAGKKKKRKKRKLPVVVPDVVVRYVSSFHRPSQSECKKAVGKFPDLDAQADCKCWDKRRYDRLDASSSP
eukprot:jgi/Bigna1/143261/aug1.77_g17969